MSNYESVVCRTFLDVTDVTKNSLITEILSKKDQLSLSNDQIKAVVRTVEIVFENSKNSGLGAFQRIGAEADREMSRSSIETKEVAGKRNARTSKSEAA
jgi:hypothetical protein